MGTWFDFFFCNDRYLNVQVDGRREQLKQTLASTAGGDEEEQEESPPQTLFEFDTGPKAE